MATSQQMTLPEAWQRYAEVFRQAEYAVKVCEHMSADISEEALVCLAHSGDFVVDALKAEHDEKLAVKHLSRACVCARRARRIALFHGMALLYKRVNEICKRYPEDLHDIVRDKITAWDDYLEHVEALRVILRNYGEGKTLRLNRSFVAKSQELMRSLLAFLDDYAAEAGRIDEAVMARRRHDYEATWGKVKKAFYSLLVSVALSALWGGRSTLMILIREII